MALSGGGGERLGIDRVGFAEDAEGADEGLDLAGVGAVGGHAGDEGRGEQRVLVAAGGLAHQEGGGLDAGEEGVEGVAPVGQRGGAPVAAVEDDDRGFADIAPEQARWRGGR